MKQRTATPNEFNVVSRLVTDRDALERKVAANKASLEQLAGLHIMLCTLVDELADQVLKLEGGSK